MDKFVGKRLDGRYEIREIIGVGGMAVVYKAYDCIEDRIVAVKILKDEFISNEEFILRFKNESKAIAVLNHPNIVKVYDVSFSDLIQYIVMEYVDGITLKQYISQQGSLRWKDAVYLTIQVLRALQHAHDKGIVHRDVKPQNIMLLADGTIKVTDFGIARFARSEHKTMTDKAIGSVHYISPEQARGEATDEKADIYSVGVMLYEMLTGRLPFEADSAVSVAIMQLQQDPVLPRDINANIPVGLEQITMHAMQKDVGKRYRSAAEMLRDLEEFRRSPDTVFEYTYFVDNEPTKFVDAVSNTTAEKTEDNTSGDDDQEEKSPVIPILAGVAIAFVVAAIIIGIIIWYSWGVKTETVTVPNFIGMEYSQLQNNADYVDYTFEVQFETSDEDAGIIIDQSFQKGRKIKKTQKITITVSSGPELATIPNIVNLDLTTAKQALKSRGFDWNIIMKTDDSIANGHVITTNPEAGGNVAYGSVIDVYVSLGAKIEYVSYGNYIGFDVEAVKKKIEDAGLTVGDITQKDSDKPAGIVIGQDPNPDTTSTIAKGSPVNLVVSTGKMSYSYKLEVKDLPTNFKDEYKMMKMSVFVDGVQQHETAKFDANVKQWSFDITSENKTANVVINIVLDEKDENGNVIKFDSVLVYSIDMSKGTATLKSDKIQEIKLKDLLAITVNTPNTVGKTLEDAKKLITDAGLIVGEITYEESTEEAGVVISQSPDPKTTSSVPKGSKIDLVVSKS